MSNTGKYVQVHYRGTLDDGTEFDSSYSHGAPLAFTCGAGQMIKGFDEAVKDMEIAQTINVRIAPEDAYGESDPKEIRTFPRMNVNADKFKEGDRIILRSISGASREGTITKMTPDIVEIDMNKPLAGKYLNFEITLLSAE